jgi:hydrogenase maturation protease
VTHQRESPSVDEVRQFALGDEMSANPRGHTVVVGCGSLLRGDDAVGPILIRHLWEQGVPDDVTLVDGGTAGMDIAFKMRGAKSVLLIDASQTGVEPGTIYRVPGEEVEELPPLAGLHSHQFRWDNALAFAHWLLRDDYPENVTVFLIEAQQTNPGADLTEPVEKAMHQVAALLRAEWESS